MRVLEALETVGEMEMLRRLEESILTGNVPLTIDPLNVPQTFQPSSSSSTSMFCGQPRSQSPLKISTNFKHDAAASNIPSSSSYHTTLADRHVPYIDSHLYSCTDCSLPSEIHAHHNTSSSHLPKPSLEVIRFVLFKDTTYNDFGFSISEGFNGEGVYVNKIRINGPADKADVKSCDKILMVREFFKSFLFLLTFGLVFYRTVFRWIL